MKEQTDPICRLCGEPQSSHTKSPADWRTVPDCTGVYLWDAPMKSPSEAPGRRQDDATPYDNVWVVTEFDGGGIRGVYPSQHAAEAGIQEIRNDHPDLTRSDFVIEAQRIRGEETLYPDGAPCSKCFERYRHTVACDAFDALPSSSSSSPVAAQTPQPTTKGDTRMDKQASSAGAATAPADTKSSER